MTQITRNIVNAFQNSRSLRIDNSRTDGESLWLFDNKIAEIRRDGLWITNAGWKSKTTKERLNGLSGVSIQQVRGNWFLNGRVWNGEWTKVRNWANADLSNAVVNEPIEEIEEFDSACEWIESGYSKPIYSVYETLNEGELTGIEEKLTNAGIKSKRMESDTVGVYKIHHFVIVHPNSHAKAITLWN